MVVVLLTKYIHNDLKYNKYDANYYAIAEIAKRSERKQERREFLIDDKDFERLSYLSKTGNVFNKASTYLPYCSNYNHSYYPMIVDVDSNNSITHRGKEKWISSFSPRKKTKKRINLYAFSPKASLISNPALSSQDIKNNILQNGSIEGIDSPKESYKKLVDHIADYNLYYEYDESVLTPQKAYFHVASGTEKKPIFGIESRSPINGFHSVSIKSKNVNVFLYFEQHFPNGQYHYSFLIKAQRGTLIQPVYNLRFNRKWKLTPICSLTVPDSQIYLISTTFVIEGLNEDDFFVVGVRLQNGKALLDDFILVREDINRIDSL